MFKHLADFFRKYVVPQVEADVTQTLLTGKVPTLTTVEHQAEAGAVAVAEHAVSNVPGL